FMRALELFFGDRCRNKQNRPTAAEVSDSASAVNERGMVVGGSSIAGDSAYHAFVWTPTRGIVDLGTLGGTYSHATAVSDNVGDSSLPGDTTYHAFMWTSTGGMVDLGAPAGRSTYGAAVSDSGVVAGVSYIPGDDFSNRAFAWTSSGGMIDLGTLGDLQNYGNAVNACCCRRRQYPWQLLSRLHVDSDRRD